MSAATDNRTLATLLIPAALLLIALAVLGWVAASEPVRRVNVAGDLTPAERGMIERAVSEAVNRRLVQVNVEAVRAAILALPWADQATVRRAWPSTVEIAVSKPVPVARWGTGGIVTSRGEIVDAEPTGHLPRIEASLSDSRSALAMLQLAKQLTVRTGLDVVALVENPMGEWAFETASGMQVRLGNEAVAERLRRFETIYRNQFPQRASDIEYVDVRYSRGLAVRWREAADGGAAPVADVAAGTTLAMFNLPGTAVQELED